MTTQPVELADVELWKVSLRKKSWAEGKSVSGQGRFVFTDFGGLQLHFFTDAKDVVLLQKASSDGFFDESEYLDVVGIDHKGERWEGSNGFVESDARSFVRTVTVSFPEISKTSPIFGEQEPPIFWLFFQGDSLFPCNRQTITTSYIGEEERSWSSHWNASRFCCPIGSFEFHKEETGFSVKWKLHEFTKTPFMVYRLKSALEFVFSKILSLYKVIEASGSTETLTIFSAVKTSSSPSGYPPFSFNVLDEKGIFWELFQKYLHRVLLYNDLQRDLLSQIVFSFVSTSDRTIETQCLALAIGIERIVGFPDFSGYQASETVDLKNLEEKLALGGVEKVLSKRLLGVVSSWNSPRADKILNSMCQNALIRREEFDSWRTIRNASAHGDISRVGDSKRLIFHLKKLATLLNQLVFSVIGYEGCFTDYSDEDMRTRIFRGPIRTSCP